MATSSFRQAGFSEHYVRIEPCHTDPQLDNLHIFALRFSQPNAAAASKKEPLLLLHGHPQNHLIYHRLGTSLAKNADRDIVIADLRGHGNSSTPKVRNLVNISTTTDGAKTEESHDNQKATTTPPPPSSSSTTTTKVKSEKNKAPTEEALQARYSKRQMARDMIEVMKALGYGRFGVVGHDRGGRVAHRMALDYPDIITRVMVLDIVPTLDLYEKADSRFATAYWHWYFLIQPYPFPESMIINTPKAYLDKMVTRFNTPGSEVFPQEVLEDYLQQLSEPDRVHATCEDYRCSAPGGYDLTLDSADRKAGRKVTMPLRALWGARGVNEALFGDGCEELWKNVCEQATGRAYDCGHYMPEELPKEMEQEILTFFA